MVVKFNVKREPVVTKKNGWVRQNSDDKKNQEEVAKIIAVKLGVRVHNFPRFHYIDWYLEQNRRIWGYGELKVRNYKHDAFEDTIVKLDKFKKMTRLAIADSIPVYLFVQFINQLRYISVQSVNPSRTKVGGSCTDQAVHVLVPVKDMNIL